MATDKRCITEAEALYAEDAYGEFTETGHTEKKCPWCAGNLYFRGGGSGFLVACTSCDFRVTVRGV